MNAKQSILVAATSVLAGWLGLASIGGSYLIFVFFTPCIGIALSVLTGAFWLWKKPPLTVFGAAAGILLAVQVLFLAALGMLGDFFDVLPLFWRQLGAGVMVTYIVYIVFVLLGPQGGGTDE